MNASLLDLPIGQHAEILSIGCGRALSRRLMEMGLLPGTRVRIVRAAPLGDPIELRLRNYSLSVRRAEASKIIVCPEEAA